MPYVGERAKPKWRYTPAIPIPAQAVTDVEALETIAEVALGAAVTSGEAPAGQGAVGATAPTESQALG
jgi:hypothetical protein